MIMEIVLRVMEPVLPGGTDNNELNYNKTMKTLRILLALCFALFFAACSKTEKDPSAGNKDGNKKEVISTAVVTTTDGSTDVDLGEGSKICFTDDRMIIKSSGKETGLPLKDLTNISYK